MIKFLYASFYACLILLTASESQGSFRSSSYEEAWDAVEGFNKSTLRNVSTLSPNDDNQLRDNNQMRNALSQSTALVSLKVLNLHNQGIDDAFIKKLCNNSTFSRVIRFNLSGNPEITEKSLEFLSNSDIIGSIRDLPQLSGSYGKPSSEIYIETQNTGISLETIKKYQAKPTRFDFSIRYLHPFTNKRTAEPVSDSIKWLQLS